MRRKTEIGRPARAVPPLSHRCDPSFPQARKSPFSPRGEKGLQAAFEVSPPQCVCIARHCDSANNLGDYSVLHHARHQGIHCCNEGERRSSRSLFRRSSMRTLKRGSLLMSVPFCPLWVAPGKQGRVGFVEEVLHRSRRNPQSSNRNEAPGPPHLRDRRFRK